MKLTFIVLETKVLNGVIYVFGGLVPTSGDYNRTTDFMWYEVNEVREKQI